MSHSLAVARLAGLAAIVFVLTDTPAAAHGMAYALRGSGEVRIVFRYASGPPMIGASYRVFAPGDTETPVATGSTDSAGEVGFRAPRDGQWRVEASDSTGQAIRARIDVRDGAPTLAGHWIPDWVAAISLALNILLGVGFVLARRVHRSPRRDIVDRAGAPHRHAASPRA